MPNNDSKELKLDVVVCPKADGVFVGQCLQHDISVQAKSLDQLKVRFSHALAAHIMDDLEADRPLLSEVPPAPRKFWDMILQGSFVDQDFPIYVPVTERKPASNVRARFAQVAEHVGA